MVLPIVGISALILLILAGRHFFVSGIEKSPEITSTQAYVDSPAMIAERNETPKPEEPQTPSTPEVAEDKAVSENTVLAVAENKVNPRIDDVKPVTPPVRAPEPPKRSAPAKMTNLPPEKQWRVQVGAYPSKADAEKVVKQIRRAGFKARIYQNPASKHVKVWVEAGENRYQAGLMVDAMKKLGFKSSFSFPPMVK